MRTEGLERSGAESKQGGIHGGEENESAVQPNRRKSAQQEIERVEDGADDQEAVVHPGDRLGKGRLEMRRFESAHAPHSGHKGELHDRGADDEKDHARRQRPEGETPAPPRKRTAALNLGEHAQLQ